ncbi:hypothetical protein CB1_002197001 [Camelus ferus]|nr:hypothetical protein CB1_002197001 [Camelus ferus]
MAVTEPYLSSHENTATVEPSGDSIYGAAVLHTSTPRTPAAIAVYAVRSAYPQQSPYAQQGTYYTQPLYTAPPHVIHHTAQRHDGDCVPCAHPSIQRQRDHYGHDGRDHYGHVSRDAHLQLRAPSVVIALQMFEDGAAQPHPEGYTASAAGLASNQDSLFNALHT